MTMRHAKKTVLSSTFTVLAIIGRACQAFSTNINHSPSTYRGSSASVFIPAARGLRPSSHSKLWRRRGASQRDSRGGAPTCSSSRLSMVDSTDLFQLQQWAGDLSQQELTHVSPVTVGVMYGTGLLMSLSPCALSLLPLTMSYIAGTEGEEAASVAAASSGDDAVSGNASGETGGRFDSIKAGFVPSAAFAAGLATVLSLLGLSATLAGRVMGSDTGGGGLGSTLLPLGASVFAVAMGLNVLELVQVDLPSFEGGLEYMTALPRNARAYLLGASSALVASPCCTPVLASILGFIASSRDPVLGLALLLTYSAGYTTPLMLAGTASGAMSSLMSAKGLTWITPLSGAMLISYGTYSGLTTLFG